MGLQIKANHAESGIADTLNLAAGMDVQLLKQYLRLGGQLSGTGTKASARVQIKGCSRQGEVWLWSQCWTDCSMLYHGSLSFLQMLISKYCTYWLQVSMHKAQAVQVRDS